MRNQMGRPLICIARRKPITPSHAMPAKTSTATANPPTTIEPNHRSRLALSKSAENPTRPKPITPKDVARSGPRSRRITRKAGTCASCKIGGKPKAASKVKPEPNPCQTGAIPGAGKSVSTKPANKEMNTWCKPKPSNKPSPLASKPTVKNSMT